MRIVVGLLSLPLWFLYVGQIISVVDFGVAQRLGLQEKPDHVDPVHSRLELWTARWDVCWLWTLPVAGILILINHPWWPGAAMIGGAAFVDAGGREAAKNLGLRGQGVRTGSPAERRLLMATCGYLLVTGGLAIAAGLNAAIC